MADSLNSREQHMYNVIQFVKNIFYTENLPISEPHNFLNIVSIHPMVKLYHLVTEMCVNSTFCKSGHK